MPELTDEDVEAYFWESEEPLVPVVAHQYRDDGTDVVAVVLVVTSKVADSSIFRIISSEKVGISFLHELKREHVRRIIAANLCFKRETIRRVLRHPAC